MSNRLQKQLIPRRIASASPTAAKIQSDLEFAVALHQRGQLIEAERIYRNILLAAPKHFNAAHLLGVVLLQRRQFVEGEQLIAQALKINPNDPGALNNRGNALVELKRFDAALASYDRAVALKPDYADAFSNRGNALLALKRFDEALASCDKAIALKLDDAVAHYNRGNALLGLKQFDVALASYDKAIVLKPDYADAFCNRGNALLELKRFDEAVASYDKAIALKPDHLEAFNNRGNALLELKRFDEALASYERALAVKPDDRYVLSGLADAALRLCDWTRTATLAAAIKTHVAEGKSIVSPFTLLGYSSDPVLQLKCTQSYLADKVSPPPRPLCNGAVRHHDKIKLAYLSADFHRHATAYLMAELFELHDRSRFEVLGVSFGADDNSDMRSRVIKSFDRFHDVRFKGDHDVAKLIDELEVDIAVDLKGYTQDSRAGILAHRPAPIQVSYLGYPATMGADFIDYVIADKIVVPFDRQPYWTERIVHLPECYQVNDSQRKIADLKLTRREAGLPPGGFVFCCFNYNYKITAPVFDVWMRLLGAVDGSVLWLFGDNDSTEANLRKEAVARGIDPARLVFAGRMPLAEHLARHALADLFLDTLPINAHTTASDALWAGLPLLTCCGESFAGRVAASLLNAVGLPELVTHTLEDYEALALQLARDAALLASIKAKLAHHRESRPLFDSARSTRHLEAAYTTMWEYCRRGESPRSFSVAPMPDIQD